MRLQLGARLRSAVCDTEVIVVRAADSEADLRCGGAPMTTGPRPREPEGPAAGLDQGSTMGKRYTDGAALEVLVVRPGRGTLTLGDRPLEVMQAKQLPSSD
jgi:hypothetical protein